MKKIIIALLSILLINTGCENHLQIVQPGATSIENFYKTDKDAEEAIAAVYASWRASLYGQFWLKNLLSDDIICGGGSRGDNSMYEQVNEYNFGAASTTVSSPFAQYYNAIYLSNLIINRIEPDTDIKKRVVAEAKTIRASVYFDLVTLWGSVPLVTTELSPDEYQQPNADKNALWQLIEQDYSDALGSNLLPKKGTGSNLTEPARLTEDAARALLGKAQLFQGKHAEALTNLSKVISDSRHSLLPDYGNVLRTVSDFSSESVFEFNSIGDNNNAFEQGNTLWGIMNGYRSDKLNLSGYFTGGHPIYPSGWGFGNPSAKLHQAFVDEEGVDGYRLNHTIKTYKQLNAMSITLNAGSSLYGNEGFFNWKHRYIGSEVIEASFGFSTTANFRVLRYGEVLLLAAEAAVQSGNSGQALTYINQIRSRAKLKALESVSLENIKKEKRLELCFEGVRFQDLVRWGDTHHLENQGQKVPVFMGLNSDGSHQVTYPYTNSAFGFKKGKHELLPFPEHEMNVNKNIKQNPGW
jgi:hypothetical protein